LTGMSGASSTNVVPSTVWASYDCRLLPGVEPRALLAELEALTEDLEGVHWEVLSELSSNGSPWEDPFFETLSAYAVEGHPEAVAAPLLSPGFTDSLFLRPVGAKAYGYIPIVIDAKERATMHGDDERLSLENLRHGTRVLFGTVLDFAGAPDGSAFLPALRDELAAIPRGTDPASIGEELALRKAIDQRVRQPEVIHDPDRRVELTLVDVENTRRLREIVATHGWPTVGVFGKDGSRDAWLLAQHADRDLAFQAEVLALIEPLVASGEVRPRDHAYLYDRVAVAEDRPQRFGTQGQCTDAGWEPFAIEDPDGVDGRRAAAGIGWDMATYRQVFDCAGLEAKAKAAYAAKDWPVCAEAYAERAAGGSPNAAVQWYNAACCGALAGDLDGAFDDLGRALEAGFTGDPRKDPDLDGLHADPRWEALGL
ncbi:MAG: peptidase dimerization domain-containing protein, partial [Myxococcales bacterium]|nr:peptidase dimerization domain-containing protein [Myxococcales bacterium]